jgi:3-deoxy-D-manno-octulosonate 8-phosphate phosphatase (KDO 8-P phosphatase)
MTEIEQRLQRITFIVCDFDGVLTDGRVWFDGEGRPFRWIHARDGTALTMWNLVGGKAALVSGLGSKAMEAIAQQWYCCECHTWVRDKLRVCREIAERHSIALEDMAFLGDDIIDLYAVQTVGVGAAVANAVPELKDAAALVLDSQGGTGALRELVQRILRAQGRLDEAMKKYCQRKDDLE